MSLYPPSRLWAALSGIDQDHESGILYADERQQWARQHPYVVPHNANTTVKMIQPTSADRGPSMAEGFRSIAERGAARRNGTAMNNNDM